MSAEASGREGELLLYFGPALGVPALPLSVGLSECPLGEHRFITQTQGRIFFF